MKVFFLALLLQFTVFMAGAQKAEVLNNKAVVDLFKAGLNSETILSKIDASACKFDVTTAGLIQLKNQKVPDEVITAMIKKTQPAQTGTTVSRNTEQGTKPATKNVPELEFVNQVYAYYPDQNKALMLEKAVANMKTKMKALGYGGTHMVYELDGDKSSYRLPASDSAIFLINTGGGAPELVLYRLKVEKKKRSAAYIQAGPYQGAKSGENAISFNIRPVSTGVYQLVPAVPLLKGEYFFAGKVVTSGTSVDVYAFGRD